MVLTHPIRQTPTQSHIAHIRYGVWTSVWPCVWWSGVRAGVCVCVNCRVNCWWVNWYVHCCVSWCVNWCVCSGVWSGVWTCELGCPLLVRSPLGRKRSSAHPLHPTPVYVFENARLAYNYSIWTDYCELVSGAFQLWEYKGQRRARSFRWLSFLYCWCSTFGLVLFYICYCDV